MSAILITGGTGSFGRAFATEALKHYKTIRIFSNDENGLVEMERECPALEYWFGDVGDKKRVQQAVNGMDTIVHAAALKHISICERNSNEAIKTNDLGSMNVVDASKGLKKVILISTDKAVQPINVYGWTKRWAEERFLEAGFSVIRFGNFVGSRGSVIPLWGTQETLTITDPNMIRYWITLGDAAKFTIECLEKMRGGEVFIPDMKKESVGSLAKRLYPQKKWKIIGAREGEKMEEVLHDNC